MEYPLCDQTVTVYRQGDGQVLRQVLENCYLELEEKLRTQDARLEKTFLLVVPGQLQRVFPGDRLVPGIGPEVADWEALLPAFLPQVLTVGKVKRFYWDGKLSHIEAG